MNKQERLFCVYQIFCEKREFVYRNFYALEIRFFVIKLR